MRFLDTDGDSKRFQTDMMLDQYREKIFLDHNEKNDDRASRNKTKETFYKTGADMKAYKLMHKKMELLRDKNTYDPLGSNFEYAKLLKLELQYKRASGRALLREAISQRLGLKYVTESQFTLEEIGKVLGVTRERVRQIEAGVFKRLKHPGQSLLTKEANYE